MSEVRTLLLTDVVDSTKPADWETRFDEARGCLNAGEALLRDVSGQLSLAILLSSRAETEHLASSR